ncbi:hypothetical protein DES52_1382 [Deinococcus yavapaiensis KR-236]|uniref:Uncharacterized protein n=1 Tax=Deinococcus yavapaiensis KR-236 TaxID=694435 RepID=A0A318SFT0_9DEIO|nr:hypothetical protein DES52_1382 [Deinococcus yavapaiensis KR-236]
MNDFDLRDELRFTATVQAYKRGLPEAHSPDPLTALIDVR